MFSGCGRSQYCDGKIVSEGSVQHLQWQVFLFDNSNIHCAQLDAFNSVLNKLMVLSRKILPDHALFVCPSDCLFVSHVFFLSNCSRSGSLLGWVWLIDYTIFASQICDGTVLAYYMFFSASAVGWGDVIVAVVFCIWANINTVVHNNNWQHYLWRLNCMWTAL